MIKFLNFLGLVRGCYLRDNWGQVYTTAYTIDPFGSRVAPVYYFNNIGHVILLDNGTCQGQSCYIKEWRRMS